MSPMGWRKCYNRHDIEDSLSHIQMVGFSEKIVSAGDIIPGNRRISKNSKHIMLFKSIIVFTFQNNFVRLYFGVVTFDTSLNFVLFFSYIYVMARRATVVDKINEPVLQGAYI